MYLTQLHFIKLHNEPKAALAGFLASAENQGLGLLTVRNARQIYGRTNRSKYRTLLQTVAMLNVGHSLCLRIEEHAWGLAVVHERLLSAISRHSRKTAFNPECVKTLHH